MGHQKVYLSAALYGVEWSCCPAAIRSAWRSLRYLAADVVARPDSSRQLKALWALCWHRASSPLCHALKAAHHKDIKVIPKGATIDCVLQPFRKMCYVLSAAFGRSV